MRFANNLNSAASGGHAVRTLGDSYDGSSRIRRRQKWHRIGSLSNLTTVSLPY